MIDGVKITRLNKAVDERGWLAEMFREDGEYIPKMGYISMTHPFVVRGPHEHLEQSDCFTFLGSFKIQLWDNRGSVVPNGDKKWAGSYDEEMVIFSHPGELLSVIVPPKVVHGYQNIGYDNGFVINHPDQLFAGKDRKEKIDEIRHEDINSKFKFDKALPIWCMEG